MPSPTRIEFPEQLDDRALEVEAKGWLPDVVVTLDDQEPKTIPRFDSWCEGHRATVMVAATDLPDEVHTVRFEIDDEQPDKVKLLAERGVTMDDPQRYDGTKWYVGYILVTGEVVE